jgi:hypothetical protein
MKKVHLLACEIKYNRRSFVGGFQGYHFVSTQNNKVTAVPKVKIRARVFHSSTF